MRDELKKSIAEAFDAGDLASREAEFRHAAQGQAAAQRYLATLLHLERSLRDAETVAVPDDFPVRVIAALPATNAGLDLRNIRATGLFIFTLITAVAAILFSRQLGLESALRLLNSLVASSDDAFAQTLFVLTSAVGILACTWLFISSFFGIRSRRISR